MPADGSCGNIGEANLCGVGVLFGCDADGGLIQKQCDECCGWVKEGEYYDCLTGADCCEPQCLDKVCGSDGCGGVCGTCEAGRSCAEETGQCENIDDGDTSSADDIGSGKKSGDSSSGCQAGTGGAGTTPFGVVLILCAMVALRVRARAAELKNQ